MSFYRCVFVRKNRPKKTIDLGGLSVTLETVSPRRALRLSKLAISIVHEDLIEAIAKQSKKLGDPDKLAALVATGITKCLTDLDETTLDEFTRLMFGGKLTIVESTGKGKAQTISPSDDSVIDDLDDIFTPTELITLIVEGCKLNLGPTSAGRATKGAPAKSTRKKPKKD